MLKREPDQKIGEAYLWRWYLIPRNRFFNIYLHQFHGSDDDRALHDHPWWSCSFLFRGYLKEHLQDGTTRRVKRFLPYFRAAREAHRLELKSKDAITVFITGPKVRSWGFYCPKGWVHWEDFTDPTGRYVGKGCE